MKRLEIENMTKDELIELIQIAIKSELQVSTTKPQKEWLSIKEAAEYINYEEKSIYGLVRKRQIPHYKRGRLLFKREELRRWIEDSRVGTIQEELEKQGI